MTPELAQDMASYNSWMNKRIYACAKEMSDAERKLDRGAFFKSIHGTLNHILVGDKIWMGRFTGAPFSVRSLDQELHSEFAALRQDRNDTDESIMSFVKKLSEEELGGNLRYTSIVSPQPLQYELWLALAHFFNHQAHHRGQVTTLFSQSGIDVGLTDLIWLPEVVQRNAT
ncbi:DinB family protein [Aestuariirhabdus sp. Z084]|uniref:DinB family protein n=1 Tax=Aestuariirhabdus haliotis TaxID=2918751 RepID=UPI00201B43AA|nr:DinB family protein [Aestuariirhabdus haliotis]MCL6416969.1 DinB family protein [Aestuariirhabdus haliotis]MCL6421024.1 DinB family protein [Aestuariirhabdus haliotis]